MDQLPLRILIVEDNPERQKTLRDLFRDHAWILVNTARRAVRLIEVFDFDFIALDFDLDGEETGDKVAEFIKQSRNANTSVWVHSMNVQGVERIQKYLPDSVAVPYSKIIRDNKTFKKLRESINKGTDIDWAYVFRRKDRTL
jgi:CheY-like chemotaxis protein